MKEVLELQKLSEEPEVDALWTPVTWTVTIFNSTVSNHCG